MQFLGKSGETNIADIFQILWNFDNSAMRALSLAACVELDNKYNVINLIVVDVEKQFGSLGSDIIHVEKVSVHTINTIECLEGYEAKIKILKNAVPFL